MDGFLLRAASELLPDTPPCYVASKHRAAGIIVGEAETLIKKARGDDR